jgi:protein SCO1/2
MANGQLSYVNVRKNKGRMNNKALWAAAALTGSIAIAAAASYLTVDRSLRGSVIDPPFEAAEIALMDSNGEPFALSQVRGNVAVIFFGFTNCPDECPLAMANLKLAVEMLGERGDQVSVLLITTDPVRDTPEALRDFVGRFNPQFLGLTGTEAHLSKVWKDYGVTVMDGGETHSNYIYVIDRSGMLVETVLADSGPADIAADLRLLLR